MQWANVLLVADPLQSGPLLTVREYLRSKGADSQALLLSELASAGLPADCREPVLRMWHAGTGDWQRETFPFC